MNFKFNWAFFYPQHSFHISQKELYFELFLLLFLNPVSVVLLGALAQKVRVEEELEAYPTESVDLRCQFIDGGGKTKLTQVGQDKYQFFQGVYEYHIPKLETFH